MLLGSGVCNLRSETLARELRHAYRMPARGYETCAVVGSSGSLLTTRFGAEIDSHDVVIRFNDAQVASFEPIVGSRTSLRVVNSQAMLTLLRKCSPPGRCDPAPGCCPNESILLNSGHAPLMECFKRVCGEAPSVQGIRMKPRHPFFITHSRRPTMSGIFGMAAAQLLCNGRIYAYGFTSATDDNTSEAQYHYYDKCSQADGEQKMLERTARRFEIGWLDNYTSIIRFRKASRLHPAFVPTPRVNLHPCPEAYEARNFSRRMFAVARPATKRVTTLSYRKYIGSGCCRGDYEKARRSGKVSQRCLAYSGPQCTQDPRQCEVNCTATASCFAFSYSHALQDCFFCRSCQSLRPAGGHSALYTTWVKIPRRVQ